MSDDYVQDELDIMDERMEDKGGLSPQTFQCSISVLCNSPVETMDISASIGEVHRVMESHNFGAVPITKEGKLAGIVTERDFLLKVVGKIQDWESRLITEVMTPNPTWLRKDDHIAYVMNKMHVGGFRHITVVNENQEPIHMISVKDLAGHILDHFPEEILNLPSEPVRGGTPREGA